MDEKTDDLIDHAHEDAVAILSRACGATLREVQNNWSPYNELAFVMVRRALRHFSCDADEMYWFPPYHE